MTKTVATGIQEFDKLIERNCFYVDKTHFIKEWWENKDDVTLITRPRRFGKTLTMSMTEQFFSLKYSGSKSLFEGLNIWKDKSYRKLQGTYPVICLSFAAIKENSFQKTRSAIYKLIAREYQRCLYLTEGDSLNAFEKDSFIKTAKMLDEDISSSLNQLSEYFYNYYGKKVIILLDEYDAPLQEAYVNGYWNEMASFIRSLFNFTFKSNPFLERAIMTGVTRVSRESVFSDLNNLEIVTTTSEKYATIFGFTENEVLQALEEFNMSDQKETVKKWYDGFRFGNYDNIYNPWSITKFLIEKKFKPYWANTSSNKLAGDLVQKGSVDIKNATEDLLQGKTFHTIIDEEIVFNQLDYDNNAIWSLLLASGYLKIINCDDGTNKSSPDGLMYELALTNLEIKSVFRKMVRGWFSGQKYEYHGFMKALLANDKEEMNFYMNKVTLAIASSFDTGKQPSETADPERFFHGLVLGLIIDLEEKYIITSNRESGPGRYDVMLEPRDYNYDGMVLEFKVIDSKKENSLQDTVTAALQQILKKRYATALESKGIPKNKIRIYGFAFEGKEVLIDGGYMTDYASTEPHRQSCRKGKS